MDLIFDVWDIAFFLFGDDLTEIIKIVAFVVLFVILSAGGKENRQPTQVKNSRRPSLTARGIWGQLESLRHTLTQTAATQPTTEPPATEMIEPAVTNVQPAPSIATAPLPPKSTEEKHGTAAITPDFALSAVAWAEILGKPKAKRP